METYKIPPQTIQVGAGWRGEIFGEQMRIAPRHLAQVLPIYHHRWARQAGKTAVPHGTIPTRLSRPYQNIRPEVET